MSMLDTAPSIRLRLCRAEERIRTLEAALQQSQRETQEAREQLARAEEISGYAGEVLGQRIVEYRGRITTLEASLSRFSADARGWTHEGSCSSCNGLSPDCATCLDRPVVR